MEKRLEVKNLSKAFNKKEVLNNISFSLYTNEVVALVGGNGAGKSTMLDILGKVSEEYKGTVDYLGLEDDEIGVMFQASSFPLGIKVKHLVQFAIQTHKLKTKESKRIKDLSQFWDLKKESELEKLKSSFELNDGSDNSIEFRKQIKDINKTYSDFLDIEKKVFKNKIRDLTIKFAVDKLMNKNANRLSGGERQRVGLLLSMIHEPKVLFLDEPTAGLDIESKNLLIKILKKEIKSRDLTVVIVTHEMAVIESIVNRIIILKNGGISIDEPIKKFKGKFISIDKAIESKVFGGDE